MAIVDDVAIGIQGASHDAQSFRQLLAAVVGQQVETFVNSIGAQGPGHGVVTAAAFAVAENGTPNLSVDVAAGIAMITGDQTLAQAPYACTNDATVNVAIATADATNARKDLIVLQVFDDTTDGSGFNKAELVAVTGTPAGSPADPTIPDNSLVLARVNVPALDTAITNSQIDDLRVRVDGWTAFTPSWTNLTATGGTHSGCFYRVRHSIIECVGKFTLGGGSSVAAGPRFTVPGGHTLDSTPNISLSVLGESTYLDNTTAQFRGEVCYVSATAVGMYRSPSGTIVTVNSTAPFTWTTGDALAWHWWAKLA